jgi:hypothetical protein
MVTGNNIAGASVTTDYPGVSIEDVVSLDSPNYLFVYMNIAAAKAGNMQLTFRKEGSRLAGQVLDEKNAFWVFSEMTPDQFHWENIRVRDDGTKELVCEIFGKRIG